MAKITQLQPPADGKNYGVPKSKGQPKLSASGHSPAQHEKSYNYIAAKGEAPTAHDGVELSKRFSIKPNLSSRRA